LFTWVIEWIIGTPEDMKLDSSLNRKSRGDRGQEEGTSR
jgi:hypothetical protein